MPGDRSIVGPHNGLLAESNGTDNIRDNRSHRVWRLKLAVLFSLASKVTAAAAQFLALTLAVRLMGQQEYAAYAAIVAISALPLALAIRNGPTFVARAAELEAAGKQDALRELVWSAVLPTAITVLIGGILATLYLVNIDLSTRFPNLPALAEPTTRWIILAMVWLQFIGAVLIIFESLQAGYQENHLLSVRSMVGNSFTILILCTILPWVPKLVVLVIAVDGVLFVTRLINSMIFVARHPYLLPRRGCVSLSAGCDLLKEAVIYTAVAGIGAYATIRLPVLLVASYGSADATTRIAIVFQVIVQLFSIVSMIAIPFVPALSHSLATGDARWGYRAIRRISGGLAMYGILCIGGLTLVAPWLFRIILGSKVDFGVGLLAGAGLYLAALGWENFFFLVLCALGRIPIAATLYLTRAVVTSLSIWLVATQGHENWIGVIAAVSVVIVTLWSYPLIVHRSMRECAMQSPVVITADL